MGFNAGEAIVPGKSTVLQGANRDRAIFQRAGRASPPSTISPLESSPSLALWRETNRGSGERQAKERPSGTN
jgi:hypothetical protein